MASSNEQITRSAFDAWSRGSLEEALATMDPDVEFHTAFRLPDLPPDVTVVRGHDEVRELWASFRDVWEKLTLELDEVLHDAGDLLVARARFRGIGAGSGVEVDRTLFYVLEMRDGRLIRMRPFDEEDEAWRAAGLPPRAS